MQTNSLFTTNRNLTMKRYQFLVLISTCLLTVAAAQPRTDITIDGGWKFLRANAPGAQAADYADSRWERVTLPHTWNARDGQDGGSDYYRGVGWYRKDLKLDRRHRGKNVFLKFDGVATSARVYVNGKLAGMHKGGFAA